MIDPDLVADGKYLGEPIPPCEHCGKHETRWFWQNTSGGQVWSACWCCFTVLLALSKNALHGAPPSFRLWAAGVHWKPPLGPVPERLATLYTRTGGPRDGFLASPEPSGDGV